jgi:hypothetical protein
VVPGDRDDQHRGVPGPPEQVPHEQQRVVVGPLEVVEHQQQRALLGGRRHQVCHRHEQPGPTVAPGNPPGARQGRQHRGELGRRLGAQRRQLVGRRGGHQAVQCFYHRLVGDDRLLVAPPEQHQALVADAPGGLGREPGLADPGLAGDDDHVAGAGRRLAPGLGQDRELPLPAHERRRPGRPCRRRGRRRRPPQQVEVSRLGLGRGVDAELVGQAPPQPLVGAQGLGPVAAGRQRGPPGPVCALPQRCPGHGRVGGGQRLVRVAGGQCGQAHDFVGGHRRLVQARPHVVGPVPGVAGQERRPQPFDRGGRRGQGAGGVAGPERLARRGQRRRGPLDIHGQLDPGRQRQLPARLPGHHRLAPAGHRGGQGRPDPADVGPERGGPGPGRPVGPEDVGQPLPGHAGRALEDQRGEDDPGRPSHRHVTYPHVTGERDLDLHGPPRFSAEGHCASRENAASSVTVATFRGSFARPLRTPSHDGPHGATGALPGGR